MKHRKNQRKTKKAEWEIQKDIAAHEYNEHLQSSIDRVDCIPKSLKKAFVSIKKQATNKANRVK